MFLLLLLIRVCSSIAIPFVRVIDFDEKVFTIGVLKLTFALRTIVKVLTLQTLVTHTIILDHSFTSIALYIWMIDWCWRFSSWWSCIDPSVLWPPNSTGLFSFNKIAISST